MNTTSTPQNRYSNTQSDFVLTNSMFSEGGLTANAVDDWLKAEAELAHGHSSSDSNTSYPTVD
jgi:hypothetical protein